MGHQTVNKEEAKQVLSAHPNFEMPVLDDPQSPISVAKFAIEAAARYISPPKEWDEDDEFACQDLAAALREDLLVKVLEALRATKRP